MLPDEASVCQDLPHNPWINGCSISDGLFLFRSLLAPVVLCVMAHCLVWFQSVVMIVDSHFDIYLLKDVPLLDLTVTNL